MTRQHEHKQQIPTPFPCPRKVQKRVPSIMSPICLNLVRSRTIAEILIHFGFSVQFCNMLKSDAPSLGLCCHRQLLGESWLPLRTGKPDQISLICLSASFLRFRKYTDSLVVCGPRICATLHSDRKFLLLGSQNNIDFLKLWCHIQTRLRNIGFLRVLHFPYF